MSPDKIRQLFKLLPLEWESNESLKSNTSLSSVELRRLLNEAAQANIINTRIRPSTGRKMVGRELASVKECDYEKVWEIKFNVSGHKYYIFKDVSHLAELHPVVPPSEFILVNSEDTQVISSKDDRSKYTGKLKNYFILTTIWKILKSCSDHSSSNSMTFLYRCKLTLKNEYDQDVLNTGFDGFAKLSKLLPLTTSSEEVLDDYKHREEKEHILQNTLVAMLDSVDVSKRFSYLLNNFATFALKFDENYQAYVVGFSFDKLRKEHEEKYREFMISINGVISSVILKSLMIPAGVFLTATRTQTIVSKSSFEIGQVQFMTNIAVGVASLIISLVFAFLLCNESHSISALKFEYKSLMKRLEDKSKPAFTAIEEHRTRLAKRITYAEDVIKYLHCANILYAIVATVWVIVRQYPLQISL
ncbi:hypothetical protein [Vibrio campbellii]|uniref:hypothetical protein n=1 Tax=Vibrio campbellii TaxID=680 RepID=UPI000CD362C6|nr:hypothetical protein [Vibrio campbellii]AUW04404.1 hypothetical protein C1N51_12150 [Vibrio campbellii]